MSLPNSKNPVQGLTQSASPHSLPKLGLKNDVTERVESSSVRSEGSVSANRCREESNEPDGKGTFCIVSDLTFFSYLCVSISIYLLFCLFSSVKTNPTVWSRMQSVGGVLGTEALPDSDSCVFTPEDTLDGLDTLETDGVWGGSDSDMLWTCVAAGAVSIDPISPPNW